MIWNKVNLSDKRRDHESMKSYRERRKRTNRDVRRYLAGTIIWSGHWGTVSAAELKKQGRR